MDIQVKDLLAIIDAIPGVSVDDPKLLALVKKHKGKSTDYRITVDFFSTWSNYYPSGFWGRSETTFIILKLTFKCTSLFCILSVTF